MRKKGVSQKKQNTSLLSLSITTEITSVHVLDTIRKTTLTRIHSSRMRTARSLTVSRSIQSEGVSAQAPPPMQTPPGCRPPAADPLWTEGMTHACEIITFPQLLLRALTMHTTTHENMNYLSSVKITIQLQDTASRYGFTIKPRLSKSMY